MGKWLYDGKMTAHSYEVLPNGLESVGEALAILKDGKLSAKKFVFRYEQFIQIAAELLITEI
jgi:hypothetical protein